MAEKNLRRTSIVVTCLICALGVIGSVVGLAWTGGGRVTASEKDIEGVKSNALEDRSAIAKNGESIEENYKTFQTFKEDIKEEISESKLRDERVAAHYNTISAYMQNESSKTDEMKDDIKEYLKGQHAMDIKLEGVKKTVENLEKAE